MIRRIIVFLCLLISPSVFGADTVNFKNCSRVPFCSHFRSLSLEDNTQYSSIRHSMRINGKTANLEITNKKGNLLNVEIQALQCDTFRIRIEEPKSRRYRLPSYVLDGEPKLTNIRLLDINDYNATLASNKNAKTKLVIRKSPFSVELYKNDVLEIIFANKLIMNNATNDQSFAFGVIFPDASYIYGGHQHAQDIVLKNTGSGGLDPYRFRNSDNYMYDASSTMALYGSVPALYGTGTSTTSGIFLFNAGELWVDIKKEGSRPSCYYMSESGSLDVFLLSGPTLKDIVRQYTDLTGLSHMPQLWTLGHHQSRYTYETQEVVKDVIANMDNDHFPMDSIWLDIDYTDQFKYFTWNPVNFSDPIEMQRNISLTNRKLVTIIDPHFKVDDSYSVYAYAKAKGYFIKTADGQNYEDQCWPGLSSWIDYLNFQARNYYSSLFSFEKFPNTTSTLAGIWNDMNEPAVFNNKYEKTVPFDTVHSEGVHHRDVHNIYGFLQTMATHRGLILRDEGKKRPFVLTRSHFAGSQRYAAIWTGDIGADWNYLRITYPMCINANLFGIVFCGGDVGGFLQEPTEELLQRWYQAGAWLPFYRAHSDKSTKRREPYLFEDSVKKVIRTAIDTHYKHIPVWYTLFFEYTRTSKPLIRPLSYHYPEDEEVFKIGNQLLVGSDILVRNVDAPGVTKVPVYFPGENDYWYQLNDKSVHKGPGYEDIKVNITFIPVFYRSGSIIARKDVIRKCTEDTLNDPYTLHINLDKDQKAEGRLYIDDFVSFDYTDKQEYNYLQLSWSGKKLEISQIDNAAKPEKFKLVIKDIVLSKLPNEGQGLYTTEVLSKDAEDNLLTNIFIDRKKITIRFK